MKTFSTIVAVAMTASCASSAHGTAHEDSPALHNSASSGRVTRQTPVHRLWLLAENAAKANGGSVLRAETVQSRHAAAVAATMGDGAPGDQSVWVVQVEGRRAFVCDACHLGGGSAAPAGRYLLLVVDAQTFQQSDFRIAAKDADLNRLGTVVALHG